MYRRCLSPARPGITLLELLIAMSLMVLIIGSLGVLARGVQMSYEHGEGYGTITQHARVVVDRIERIVNEATANEQFPGVLVLSETESGSAFPDTLVVWHPTGTPADAAGLPRMNEIVVFCPNPESPSQLLEITAPSDATVMPAAADQASWLSMVQAMKSSTQTEKTCLTNLMRSCLANGTTSTRSRGAIRFAARKTPSDAEWAAYVAGTQPWASLSWVQGSYGATMGLCQAWVRFDLQLTPASNVAATNEYVMTPVPFFGSAAVYLQLQKRN
jgi:hypothetical protein